MILNQVLTFTPEELLEIAGTSIAHKLMANTGDPERGDRIPDEPMTLLRPTGETFDSTAIFMRKAIAPGNGKRFGGRDWKLTGENESVVIPIRATTQYTIDIPKPEKAEKKPVKSPK